MSGLPACTVGDLGCGEAPCVCRYPEDGWEPTQIQREVLGYRNADGSVKPYFTDRWDDLDYLVNVGFATWHTSPVFGGPDRGYYRATEEGVAALLRALPGGGE